MNHYLWLLRNDTLIVQKYIGTVDAEILIKNDISIFENIKHTNPLLFLADISEATFPKISLEKINKLFASFDLFPEKTKGMKFAIYTGANGFEDFQKATSFVKAGMNKSFSILVFNFLDLAMNWLELNEDEQEEISEKFRKVSSHVGDSEDIDQ